MKRDFEVTGLYYESNGYKLRKYLDIHRKGSDQHIPDLMVVMMNPGSSYPLDGVDNSTIPTPAEPDRLCQSIKPV